jgi:hypothetical protein
MPGDQPGQQLERCRGQERVFEVWLCSQVRYIYVAYCA